MEKGVMDGTIRPTSVQLDCVFGVSVQGASICALGSFPIVAPMKKLSQPQFLTGLFIFEKRLGK